MCNFLHTLFILGTINKNLYKYYLIMLVSIMQDALANPIAGAFLFSLLETITKVGAS